MKGTEELMSPQSSILSPFLVLEVAKPARVERLQVESTDFEGECDLNGDLMGQSEVTGIVSDDAVPNGEE